MTNRDEAREGLVAALQHADIFEYSRIEKPVLTEDLRALLSPEQGWREIESAPKDGRHFLAYEDTGDMYRAAFHRDGYLIAFCGQPVVQSPEPTHWMPLPAPPTKGGE